MTVGDKTVSDRTVSDKAVRAKTVSKEREWSERRAGGGHAREKSGAFGLSQIPKAAIGGTRFGLRVHEQKHLPPAIAKAAKRRPFFFFYPKFRISGLEG